MRDTHYRNRPERRRGADRSHSLRDEDYDNYSDYNDIEDEGYERGGYGRLRGRVETEEDYSFTDRDVESYREEDVRGRRGLADIDPIERHPIRRNEPSGRRDRH